MDKELVIVYVDNPDESVLGIIGAGIRDFNHQRQVDDQKLQPLCFVLYASDQTIVGGVTGATYWNWLYIDLLWVKDEFRGCGYGHRLLMLAENEARQRGVTNAYLDSYSFQAPNFYEKHGYQVFGKLENFPAGHQRLFLQKQL
jgi:GNAT superfamily N-acetyltransferase